MNEEIEHSALDLDVDRKLIDDKLAIPAERYILFLFFELERDLLGINTPSIPSLVQRILREASDGSITTPLLRVLISEHDYDRERCLRTLWEMFRHSIISRKDYSTTTLDLETIESLIDEEEEIMVMEGVSVVSQRHEGEESYFLSLTLSALLRLLNKKEPRDWSQVSVQKTLNMLQSSPCPVNRDLTHNFISPWRTEDPELTGEAKRDIAYYMARDAFSALENYVDALKAVDVLRNLDRFEIRINQAKMEIRERIARLGKQLASVGLLRMIDGIVLRILILKEFPSSIEEAQEKADHVHELGSTGEIVGQLVTRARRGDISLPEVFRKAINEDPPSLATADWLAALGRLYPAIYLQKLAETILQETQEKYSEKFRESEFRQLVELLQDQEKYESIRGISEFLDQLLVNIDALVSYYSLGKIEDIRHQYLRGE